MGLEANSALMDKLGSLGESLPGLDLDKIIENMAKKAEAIKAQIDSIKEEVDELRNRDRITADEAKKMVKDKMKAIVDKFKENIKRMVQDAIIEIKAAWKEIKAQIEQIPKDVQNAITTILTPPAIGVPPVAPNPIYALQLAAQTKSLLVAILNALASSMVKLIKAASMILFEVPQPVIAVGATIKVLDTILNTIPV